MSRQDDRRRELRIVAKAWSDLAPAVRLDALMTLVAQYRQRGLILGVVVGFICGLCVAALYAAPWLF
jgi:hypothetical protein